MEAKKIYNLVSLNKINKNSIVRYIIQNDKLLELGELYNNTLLNTYDLLCKSSLIINPNNIYHNNYE